jgi:hypothetical protein
MKKIIYLLMVTTLVFISGCNPMDEINQDLADANPLIISGDAFIILTDDDYKEMGVNNGFSSVDEAKTLLPAFLADLYPYWGKDSSALVEYKLLDGLSNVSDIDAYSAAETYKLANSDYPQSNVNAIAFFPEEDPTDYLGDILASNIVDPEEGQIVLATYKQYVTEPVLGISNYFEADFTDGTLGNFEAVSVLGDNQVWKGTTSYGAVVSGYDSGTRYTNEDWLISPEVDLTGRTNLTFQINQALNYAGGRLDLINILVSADYTTGGDPNASTWDVIDLAIKPNGTSWSFVLSEDYDFSAYNDKKIHVAFKYESSGPDNVASTWEIKQAVIKLPGVEGETDSRGMYYIYNGDSWEPAVGVYYLSYSDYDSMGTGSGEPGKYNNFDSSVAPDDYIPNFLKLKIPYAQEEDELIVMYRYYSGSTNVRGNLYTVVANEWVGSHPSLQFGNDGNTWVPDNTIKYILTSADYELVGNGKYNNFDVRAGKGEETVEVRLAKINTILLNNFPGAEEGQKFNVFYNVYSGANEVWNMKVILSGGEYLLLE